MQTRKPLDTIAYAIVGASIAALAAGLLLRNWSAAHFAPGITAVASAATHTFAASKRSAWVLDSRGEIADQTVTTALGFTGAIIDAIPAGESVFALDTNGNLSSCTLAPKLDCVPRAITGLGQVQSGKLALSKNGKWLAVTDNGRDTLHIVDLAASRVISSSGRGAKLQNPNRAVFLDDGIVLANTGGHHLVRWPISPDATPNVSADPEVILTTSAQPYYIIPDAGWTVLQARSMLRNARARIYPSIGAQSEITLPVRDPSLLVADRDGALLVASYDELSIYRQGPDGFASLLAPSAAAQFEKEKALNKRVIWLGELGLILAIVALPLAAALLYFFGYELNQAIGATRNMSPSTMPSSDSLRSTNLSTDLSVDLSEPVTSRQIVVMTSILSFLLVGLLGVVLISATKDFRLLTFILGPIVAIVVIVLVVSVTSQSYRAGKLTFTRDTLFAESKKSIKSYPVSEVDAVWSDPERGTLRGLLMNGRKIYSSTPSTAFQKNGVRTTELAKLHSLTLRLVPEGNHFSSMWSRAVARARRGQHIPLLIFCAQTLFIVAVAVSTVLSK